MPVSVDPVFGSFNYEDGSADMAEWNEETPVRAPVVEVPRSDIARTLDGYLSPRQISARGTVGLDGGSDLETFRNLVDAFRWAHRPGVRNLYLYTDRYLKAQVESVTVGDFLGHSHAPYTLRFRCADPYWYAATGDTDTWTAPTNGATRIVTAGGAATSLPVFTITLGSTGTLALDLFNDTLTSENQFGLDGAVTSGQVLVVDTAQQTVKLAGSNKMSMFSGTFFPLNPGANSLRLVLSGVTITQIMTTWVKRWL